MSYLSSFALPNKIWIITSSVTKAGWLVTRFWSWRVLGMCPICCYLHVLGMWLTWRWGPLFFPQQNLLDGLFSLTVQFSPSFLYVSEKINLNSKINSRIFSLFNSVVVCSVAFVHIILLYAVGDLKTKRHTSFLPEASDYEKYYCNIL